MEMGRPTILNEPLASKVFWSPPTAGGREAVEKLLLSVIWAMTWETQTVGEM